MHVMLHYEDWVQRFGHLVKDSTKRQERNNSKMCMGSDCQLYRNIQYEQEIPNNYLHILVLQMQWLHLRQWAKEGH